MLVEKVGDLKYFSLFHRGSNRVLISFSGWDPGLKRVDYREAIISFLEGL